MSPNGRRPGIAPILEPGAEVNARAVHFGRCDVRVQYVTELGERTCGRRAWRTGPGGVSVTIPDANDADLSEAVRYE